MAKLTTDRQIKTAAPGRHGVSDVKGLLLDVTAGGSRSWLLRIQRDHKRHDLGLGPYPEITLAEARAKALERRRAILAGAAPLAHRQRPKGLTFRQAAEALIENKRSGWKNGKHAAQWPSTLVAYVYPVLGDLDVSKIDTRTCWPCCGRSGPRRPRRRAGCGSGSRPCWTTRRRWARAPATTRRVGGAISTTCCPDPPR